MINKPVVSMMLTCPECKKTFEYDAVGEYQLVPCPICGMELITIRKGQRMLLQGFDFNPANSNDELDFAHIAEMR